MVLVIEAVYEDGVFKPVKKLDLPEHQLLRLTVQEACCGKPGLKRKRITLAPELARAIIEDPEFSLMGD